MRAAAWAASSSSFSESLRLPYKIWAKQLRRLDCSHRLSSPPATCFLLAGCWHTPSLSNLESSPTERQTICGSTENTNCHPRQRIQIVIQLAKILVETRSLLDPYLDLIWSMVTSQALRGQWHIPKLHCCSGIVSKILLSIYVTLSLIRSVRAEALWAL